MRYGFIVALVFAFVGISHIADKSAGGQRNVTGTVRTWKAGEFMTIARQSADPGFEVGLRRNTMFDGDEAIQPGVRVTVWYRNLGDRRLIADRVMVLSPANR